MTNHIINPARSRRTTWHDPFFSDVLSRVFGDNVYAGTSNNGAGQSASASERSISPRTDIYESDSAFTLNLDLPGVNKDAINVDLSEGILAITAECSNSEAPEDTETRRRERFRGRFYRQFSVGDAIEEDAISAQYADGVLKLTLPKRSEPVVNARRIEIH